MAYKLITNESLFDTVLKASPASSNTRIIRQNNGALRLKVTGADQIMLADGTIVSPTIDLVNSERPGVALKLHLGVLRHICTNGLIVGFGQANRIVHVQGPKVENFLETLNDRIVALWQIIASGQLQDKLNKLITDTRITPAMQDIILKNLYLRNAITERVYHLAQRGWYRRSVDDHTLFGLFNYIQELTAKTVKGNKFYTLNDKLLTELEYSYKLAA